MKGFWYTDLEECLLKRFSNVASRKSSLEKMYWKKKQKTMLKKLRHTNFRHRWMESFKKWSNIVWCKLCGKVYLSIIKLIQIGWNTTTILKDYDVQEIFNVDKTRLFFKTLQEKTVVFKVDTQQGGKQSIKSILHVFSCQYEWNRKADSLY